MVGLVRGGHAGDEAGAHVATEITFLLGYLHNRREMYIGKIT